MMGAAEVSNSTSQYSSGLALLYTRVVFDLPAGLPPKTVVARVRWIHRTPVHQTRNDDSPPVTKKMKRAMHPEVDAHSWGTQTAITEITPQCTESAFATLLDQSMVSSDSVRCEVEACSHQGIMKALISTPTNWTIGSLRYVVYGRVYATPPPQLPTSLCPMNLDWSLSNDACVKITKSHKIRIGSNRKWV